MCLCSGLRGSGRRRGRAGRQLQTRIGSARGAVDRIATGVSSIAGGAIVGNPIAVRFLRQRIDALHAEEAGGAAGRPAAAIAVGCIHDCAGRVAQRELLAGVGKRAGVHLLGRYVRNACVRRALQHKVATRGDGATEGD